MGEDEEFESRSCSGVSRDLRSSIACNARAILKYVKMIQDEYCLSLPNKTRLARLIRQIKSDAREIEVAVSDIDD